MENCKKIKIKREVVDLTKDGIDEDVTQYLALGPNFSETPTRIPYGDYITTTEAMCRTIQMEIGNHEEKRPELEIEIANLREQVRKTLTRWIKSRPKSNLTMSERRGRKK